MVQKAREGPTQKVAVLNSYVRHTFYQQETQHEVIMADQTIKSVNPANDTVIEEFTPHTPAQVPTAITDDDACLAGCRNTRFLSRRGRM